MATKRTPCKCGKMPSVKLKSGCIYQLSCKKCKKYTSHYSRLDQAEREWNKEIYWRKGRQNEKKL